MFGHIFTRLRQKKRERTQGAPSFSFFDGERLGAEPARTASAMYAPLCASLCYVRTRSACESGSHLPRSRGKLAYLRQVWRYSHSETPVRERTYASFHKLIGQANDLGGDFFAFCLYDSVIDRIGETCKNTTDNADDNAYNHSHIFV